VEWVRRKKFELFFYSHYLFVPFYFFALAHIPTTFMPYLITTVVLYGLDRFLRMFWGLYPVRATMVRRKADRVIQIRYPKHPLAACMNLYKVGQYVFVSFPRISFFEWHPFSVSSGPDEITGEIHIKGLGDHTNKLVDFCDSKRRLWMRVDGPYGGHSINYRRYPNLMLVAGGVGITPMIGILKDIFRIGDLDPEDREPGHHLINLVTLVWVMPTVDAYDWFSEEVEQCLTASGVNNAMLNVLVYVTKATEAEREKLVRSKKPNVRFAPGRPPIHDLFDRMVAADKGPEDTRAATVFVCGPESLVNDCWDSSSSWLQQGYRIDFHHETFEF